MHACLFYRVPLCLPQPLQEEHMCVLSLAERAWQFFTCTPMEDEHEDKLQESLLACFSQFCD